MWFDEGAFWIKEKENSGQRKYLSVDDHSERSATQERHYRVELVCNDVNYIIIISVITIITVIINGEFSPFPMTPSHRCQNLFNWNRRTDKTIIRNIVIYTGEVDLNVELFMVLNDAPLHAEVKGERRYNWNLKLDAR
jgi:hypothetical protein